MEHLQRSGVADGPRCRSWSEPQHADDRVPIRSPLRLRRDRRRGCRSGLRKSNAMKAAGSIEIEGMTDEDRAYDGSTFREVVDAVFANPYQRVWGGYGEPPLPVHEVTLGGVLHGVLRSGRIALLKASERTVDSGADLRWGPDGRGFRRLLHPNGICLVGRWQITESAAYSGYFAAGKTALVVARYSTCCTETRRGFTRSLSLVGKLFPTAEPEDPR